MNFIFMYTVNLIFSVLIFCFIMCFTMMLLLFMNKSSFFIDWEFMNFYNMKFNFPILLDFFSMTFLTLVFFISSLIMIYSKSYMIHDKYKNRFIYILFLFIISMFFLIISPNLVSLLLGWDGLGLVSYCLIIHYQNFKSNSAGMLTVLTNRVGDCFLIISICFLMNSYTWNFIYLLNMNMNIMLLICLGAMTKSAQIPFSSWLPAAMAAPTPVSSLVHSSTLVTAGIYLLIRFNKLFFVSKSSCKLLVFLSLMTTFMAGLMANLEMDMKKIIALSTLSQLGIMMTSISIGLVEMAFFHLIMHALFKALMFMCSGNFIHWNNNSQDLRLYGKMMFISPFTSIMFSFSNLSLCGFPYLCGFFSKDMIIEMFLMKTVSYIELIIFIMGSFFTVMYTLRVMKHMMIFSSNYYSGFFLSDLNFSMNFSKFPLFIFSIFMGFLFTELFLSPLNLVVLSKKLKLLMLFICFFSVSISYTVINFMKLLKMSFLFLEFTDSMFFFTIMNKKSFLWFSFFMSKNFKYEFTDNLLENFYGSKIKKSFLSFLTILNMKMTKMLNFQLIMFINSIMILLIFIN